MGASSASWVSGDDMALSWLRSVSWDSDIAGHHIVPMPDRVWVLHPLFERLDGGSMDGLYPDLGPDGRVVFTDDDERHQFQVRRVTWQAYAARRGIPMFHGQGWPSLRDALPGIWTDDSVSSPSEGVIADERTRSALFDTLVEQSGGGINTGCTAWWYDFHIDNEGSDRRRDLWHGPLGACRELDDREDGASGPQNLWPDDHTWVLDTHTDSWATAVSGPVRLIEALIRHPELEARRLDLR